MTIELCREIAARIWCDHEYSHIEMNTELAEEIAQKLYLYAIQRENSAEGIVR